jgi:hypothetical protein
MAAERPAQEMIGARGLDGADFIEIVDGHGLDGGGTLHRLADAASLEAVDGPIWGQMA